MAKKKYNSYNSDLFNKTNLNNESTPESVHLKGTGVEKTDAGKQDTASYSQETVVSKKRLADSEQMASYEMFSKENVSEKNYIESQSESPFLEVENNQDDSQLEVMNFGFNSIINFAKNGFEGLGRYLMGEYEDGRAMERKSDTRLL